MAKDTTPLGIRCERAIKENKGFSIQENNERFSISPAEAKQLLSYINLLSVNTRIAFQALPIANQLKLAETLPLFYPNAAE